MEKVLVWYCNAEMHLRKYDQFNNLKVTLKENGSTLKLL